MWKWPRTTVTRALYRYHFQRRPVTILYIYRYTPKYHTDVFSKRVHNFVSKDTSIYLFRNWFGRWKSRKYNGWRIAMIYRGLSSLFVAASELQWDKWAPYVRRYLPRTSLDSCVLSSSISFYKVTRLNIKLMIYRKFSAFKCNPSLLLSSQILQFCAHAKKNIRVDV